MADSTAAQANGKPTKPYADFPLYAHASGRWAKKIKGRTHFFGPWRDWQAAFDKYQYEMPWLIQGKTPPPRNQGALTVGHMVNAMLEQKESEVQSGEMSQRTWDDYKRTGEFLVKELGRHTTVESLTPEDFAGLRKKIGKTRGLVALGNEIGRCLVFFNYAHDNHMIEHKVRTGTSFKKPSRKSVKKAKEAQPKKIFTVDELRTLYHAAGKQMRAFMLLALNGGLGNSDLGQLEHRHIKDGWIIYPRPKTLVHRTFPLWDETIAAIEAAKDKDSHLVFTTKYGAPWFKGDTPGKMDDPLSKEFRKLCIDRKLHQKGRGFYSLRHQFRTVADGCRDLVAIDHIMGHSDDSMGANYREWIEPERLQAVVDHVRAWVAPMFVAPVAKEQKQ